MWCAPAAHLEYAQRSTLSRTRPVRDVERVVWMTKAAARSGSDHTVAYTLGGGCRRRPNPARCVDLPGSCPGRARRSSRRGRAMASNGALVIETGRLHGPFAQGSFYRRHPRGPRQNRLGANKRAHCPSRCLRGASRAGVGGLSFNERDLFVTCGLAGADRNHARTSALWPASVRARRFSSSRCLCGRACAST